jgi:tetratricopeptide (TPR) repeat protein
LLTTARTEAAALEPEMRSFVLWHVAMGLEVMDPEKSREELKGAFAASQPVEEKQVEENCGMDEVCHQKRFLQLGILREIALRAPDEAENLLPQADPEVKEAITSELILRYTHKKDLVRAETLLLGMGDAKGYPFEAASELIAALPKSSPQRLSIFLQAVNNFRQQNSDHLVSLTDDLGAIVNRFWETLPPTAVLDAIDVLLDSAKEQDKRHVMRVGFTAGAGGAASFDSVYKLRLFQLLPVLEQLDKSRAEDLLKENADTRSMLYQYPLGVQSLVTPTGSGSVKNSGIYSTEYSMDSDPGKEAAMQARQQQRAELKRRLDQISEEIVKDPKQAFSNAMSLPLKGIGEVMLSPRVIGLMQVARGTMQKHPDIARNALEETRKNLDDVTLFQRGQFLAQIADSYVQMKQFEDAKKTLQEAMKAAEKLYAKDTDADDPNLAFKGVWPSTGLWWKCVQTAAAISPGLPEELIAEIGDTEIATFQRVAYANSLLGRRETPELAEQHKDGMASVMSF